MSIKEMSRETLTDQNGVPLPSNEFSLTAGENGPILLQDFVFLDKLAHFDRERIPERVVHARGAGAHGYFEVTTEEGKKYCKANFLNMVGKRTPIFTRFSTVIGEKGSADVARDPRGFAIKFYTDEGNFDMVANNTPVFFIRDAIKFPDFIHALKPNPQNHLPDTTAFWDFMCNHQESCHQFLILFTDRGTPDGFRHMHGFGNHTFKLVNEQGKAVWSKWHFICDQGIKNLTDKDAKRIAGEDPHYSIRDLFETIEKGGEASWTVKLQIIPIEAAESYRFNIFDVTKVVSHKDYPLIEIGKMVLDKNPINYFAEVEQSAFAVSRLVPGIEPSPDKMMQGRLFSYTDTQRYRLGPNFLQLPINRPRTKVATYMRDSLMNVTDNGGSAVNYQPNSFLGPVADPSKDVKQFTVAGQVGRYPVKTFSAEDDFIQPGILWREVLSEKDRKHTIMNIADHMKFAKLEIQQKAVALWSKVDKDLGKRLAETLSLKNA